VKPCDCKHAEYCKIVDYQKCIGRNEPWCKSDNKIMGMSTEEINKMQGRDKDLKK